MTRAFNRRPSLRATSSGVLLVLTIVLALVAAPAVGASSKSAAAVTTMSVAYSLGGQMGGAALAGWLSGSQDSTGILTATLTVADPTTDAPVTADVSGRIVGTGSHAIVLLAVTPSAGSRMMGGSSGMVMAGTAVGKIGQWAGTITQGSTYVGSWMLTPQTSNVHIDMGGKSAAGSTDKVVVSGGISLSATAAGWADGTLTTFAGKTYVVHGWMNSGGDVQVTIPWGKGTVVLIGTKRALLDHHAWNGSFIGPAAGDFGTWTGQG